MTFMVGVLLSGGLDSVVLLHDIIDIHGADKVTAIAFDYGQRHRKELECAEYWIEKFSLPSVKVPMGFLGSIVGEASLLGASEDLAKSYVPFRNMIFLSISLSIAESRGLDMLAYGAHADDEHGYWDCRDEFVNAVQHIANMSGKKIYLYTPYLHEPKSFIILEGKRLGVDFSHTWSCYLGGEKPCGECPTCCVRKKAFEEANTVDPLTL